MIESHLLASKDNPHIKDLENVKKPPTVAQNFINSMKEIQNDPIQKRNQTAHEPHCNTQ